MAKSWRTAVRHRTGYEYAGEVRSSFNLARMTPSTTSRQTLLEHRFQTLPTVSTFRYLDYWGTVVHTFDVHVPHEALEVVATSVVETTDAAAVARDVSWDQLGDPAVCDRHCEMLAASTMVEAGSATTAIAATLAPSDAPGAVVDATARWVRDHLVYQRGITSVSTRSDEVLAAGRGVCQDFAHVTIGLLRALGVPARYVSGYLYPDSDADAGTTVRGESHAWVEAWLGEWVAVDPTNGEPVGQRHIRVAHGRDYADVPPLSGIYHGAPSKSLGVAVELTRL
ncbi:MAG TPA: transglutaminase family protein [Acidimicrobiia bacterium]